MSIVIRGADVDQEIAIRDHLTILTAGGPIITHRSLSAVPVGSPIKETVTSGRDGVGIALDVNAGNITHLEFDVIDAVAVSGIGIIGIVGVGADRKRPGNGGNRSGRCR